MFLNFINPIIAEPIPGNKGESITTNMFMELPPELRGIIYGYILASPPQYSPWPCGTLDHRRLY